MPLLAMTSPLAPVVAAVEGLRLQYPDLVRCVAPGLMTSGGEGWRPGTDRCAVAVLLVAGWTRARRVPLPVDGETFLNQAGQLGLRRARVAVLCDDPVAGAPGVVVAATRDELLSIVLEHAVEAGPELRSTMRKLYGRPAAPGAARRDATTDRRLAAPGPPQHHRGDQQRSTMQKAHSGS